MVQFEAKPVLVMIKKIFLEEGAYIVCGGGGGGGGAGVLLPYIQYTYSRVGVYTSRSHIRSKQRVVTKVDCAKHMLAVLRAPLCHIRAHNKRRGSSIFSVLFRDDDDATSRAAFV